MAWIDLKKAFDIVPHSWLVKCLVLFGAVNNLMALLEQSMSSWRTELTTGEQVLDEVDIKRGIFQGDSLSLLLFLVALIPLTLILHEKDQSKVRSWNHLLYMDDLKLYGRKE